jgi:hypothetical protein
MPFSSDKRIGELERRVQEALHESPEMRERSTFSEYAPAAAKRFREILGRASAAGGIGGIELALDEFDRMNASEDPLALRYALQLFLTHSRDAASLGLQVPSLGERNPWIVTPSRPKK